MFGVSYANFILCNKLLAVNTESVIRYDMIQSVALFYGISYILNDD